MKIYSLLFLFLINTVVFASRLSLVSFPLHNETSSTLHDWIGVSLLEMAGRNFQQIDQLQFWDPVYLFQADSINGNINDNKLLGLQKKRWGWDAAVGGSYYVENDSVHFTIHIKWYSNDDVPMEIKVLQSSRLEDIRDCLGQLSIRILSAIKFSLSNKDSISLINYPPVPFSAYKTYVAGYGLELHGNNSGAISAYTRVLEMEPRFGFALVRLARLFKLSGNYKLAQKWFSKCLEVTDDPLIVSEVLSFYVDAKLIKDASITLKRNPKLVKTVAGMKAVGSYYIAVGEYQRAIALLTKAVAHGASDLEVENYLGAAYLAAGEFVKATDIFNRLIKFKPDCVRYYSLLGVAHRSAGKLMEASIVLQNALEMDPDNITVLIELASTYFDLQWYERALLLLQRAHELNPKRTDINVNSGVIYWHLGKKEEAKRLFNQALKNSSSRQAALTNYGNLLVTDGNTRKALRLFKKARQFGMNANVYENIAILYEKKGKFRKAFYFYDELLKLNSSRLDILLKQASLADKNRQYGVAETYYRKALDYSPYDKDVVSGLVNNLIDQKRYEDAVKPVETYLEHIPLDKNFMLLLGKLYRLMGWYEVSIMKYQLVIRDFPDDPQGYEGLGESIYEMKVKKNTGNVEDAIYALKRAAERDPKNPRPLILCGDIYMNLKGYKELAVDQWKRLCH